MAGYNTGTSVLGIAFDGGVIMAADTLVSYGSMAKFRNCPRMMVVNKHTVFGATGDYSDYQFLSKVIKQKQIEEKQWNDGLELYPEALHSWITRVAYNRRSKFEPLWNAWIVGGLQPNEHTGKLEPFLGFVDKLGTAYKSNVISTGFGAYLATPLFRELTESADRLVSEQEALELMKKAMKLLYKRDARSLPKYQIVTVKADGVKTDEVVVEVDWDIAQHAEKEGVDYY